MSGRRPIPGFLMTDSLEISEKFVVCAARVYRALREHVGPGGTCLCRIFHAAELGPALPPFICFQNALSADPEQSLQADERGARFVSEREIRLLRAVAWWQHYPAENPESALLFVAPPTIRRIAAPAGRAFAVEMAAAGLFVPQRQATPIAAGDRFDEQTRMH